MIVFTPKAYQKLKYFVANTRNEISGIGKSKFLDNETIIIQDVEILDQENTGGSTVLDEGAMARFLNENIDESEHWNIWWHSHADMGAFWSLTDDNTIEETTGGNYLISLVVNRSMKMLARFDLFNPLRLTLELNIYKSKGRPRESKQYLINYCQRRIKKCVKTITYKRYDFGGKQTFLTPQNSKNPSQSLEQEILEEQLRMDYPNLDWPQ
jgi:hypothetical protein